MGASHKSFEYTENKWQSEAFCRGLDPDLFFPSTEEQQTEVAKLCGYCAVREACLEYAITTKESYGVWGGKTEHERKIIIKKRRAS